MDMDAVVEWMGETILFCSLNLNWDAQSLRGSIFQGKVGFKFVSLDVLLSSPIFLPHPLLLLCSPSPPPPSIKGILYLSKGISAEAWGFLESKFGVVSGGEIIVWQGTVGDSGGWHWFKKSGTLLTTLGIFAQDISLKMLFVGLPATVEPIYLQAVCLT